MKQKVVDFLCYEKHFMDHLVPMFFGLPEEYRGSFLCRSALVSHAKKRGVPALGYGATRSQAVNFVRQRGNMVVAAASGDLKIAKQAGVMAVFTQHGAGQSFTTPHSSYAGWPHHKNVMSFLHPGDHPAERDRNAYKNSKPVHVIGCPKMDGWHSGENQQPQNELPVVVFSTHWDCKVVPETRSAFYHMLPGLQQLASLNGEKFILKGHGHPRILHKIKDEYAKLGIEVIGHFGQVMNQADLYVMDHMSTLYEFASAGKDGDGRPVVVMNMPAYRRNVNHGLRFWDAAHVGLNVDQPAQLVDTVMEALEDEPGVRQDRREAVDLVYKYTDGNAGKRAGDAIKAAADKYVPIAQRKVVISTHKKKRSTRMKTTDHFAKPQVPQIAINRLRNDRRGFMPDGAEGVKQGINVRPGRLFWTDEQHAKELKNLGHSRDPLASESNTPFPGVGKTTDGPAETLTADNMPVWEAKHTSGGYYDIVEDGQVTQQIRGKKKAEAHVKKLQDEWKEKNLQSETN